jgi:hypothetical protein
MKRLHINYIWIDSLCIVQDDADDWAAQAAQMANIYSNAFLTIAATCAPDSTHGLFSKTPDIYLSETFHIPRLDGSSYPVRVRHLSKFHMREHYNEHSALVGPPATWPLLKRAWVFQERLLSPRLLHFSFGELIWERRHVSACECSAIASQQKDDHNSNIRKKDVFHFHLKRRIWGAEMDCTMWHDIVAAYTDLQLSFPKDVFPALSGIAQRIHEKRESRYLAGLWQDTLCADLAWTTSSWDANKKRPSTWRAPSWCWASVDAAIQFRHMDRLQATLLEANIVPLSSDGFGELDTASITLRGWEFEAEVQMDEYGYCSFEPPSFDKKIGDIKAMTNVVFDDAEDDKGRDGSVLRFLKVASAFNKIDDERPTLGHTYYFLVLEVFDDQQDAAVFKRVGLASCRIWEAEDRRDILGSQETWTII